MSANGTQDELDLQRQVFARPAASAASSFASASSSSSATFAIANAGETANDAHANAEDGAIAFAMPTEQLYAYQGRHFFLREGAYVPVGAAMQ